jgi:hypothetical protein
MLEYKTRRNAKGCRKQGQSHGRHVSGRADRPLNMFDDDDFELDPAGNRGLIGLSTEETDEFLKLEKAITTIGPLVSILNDESYSPEQRRWLELFDKHTIAKLPFLQTGKTKH